MADDRPNIVFINVDQWRYDCLSIAGHPVVETPNLDGLAHCGVRFTNAFSGVPTCIAARAALHTGMSQRNHGRVGYQDGVAWSYPVTLAGELTRAGYQTQAVGKMHVHPQRWKAGFEDVTLHDGFLHHYRKDREDDYEAWLLAQTRGEATYFDHGLESNSWVARPWHLPEWMHPTTWAFTQSCRFLARRDPTRPFFLFLSLVRPHPPLDPPQVYWDQYIGQDIPPPPVGDWADALPRRGSRWKVTTQFARLHPRAQHRAQAAYYAQLTHIDHQIGRFVEYLRDYRLCENTVFLFCSDHGELLGDHHLFCKNLPYAGSAQVPLILSGLGGPLGTPDGRCLDQLVELRDVMPTLLELAGAPIPETVDGRSVLPLAAGQDVPWRRHLHGEHAAGPWSNHFIVDGTHKYVWYSQTGTEQLFDIGADRQELHDLADRPEHHETVRRLRSVLAAELAGREEGYSDGENLQVGCTPVACLSHILPP